MFDNQQWCVPQAVHKQFSYSHVVCDFLLPRQAYGAHDSLACLDSDPGAKSAFMADLEKQLDAYWDRTSGGEVACQLKVGPVAKGGVKVVFVREWNNQTMSTYPASVKGFWQREFFCENWNGTKCRVVDEGAGVCHLDMVGKPQVRKC